MLYAWIGTPARRAHVARTGEDPGEIVALHLAPGPRWPDEAKRTEIAGRLACYASTPDERRRITGPDGVYQTLPPACIPGALYLYAPGADDTTPEAVLAALDEAAAEHARQRADRAAEHARREAERDERRRAELDALRTGPVRDLLYCGRFGWTVRDAETAQTIGRYDEAETEAARLNTEEDAARTARKADEEARTAARLEWIKAHGSDRLRRLVAEGIESTAVYHDERLTAERPGWQWAANAPGNDDAPRNAPEDALALLDEARGTLPEPERQDATLRYYRIAACGEECEDSEYPTDDAHTCPGYHAGAREYVVITTYLDRDILYGLDRLPDKED